MNYVDPFGGSPVNPVDISYKAIALSANLTLEWPSFSATGNVVARIMEVTPSGAGLSISMPPADQAGVGIDSLIRNLGASTFSVFDNSGNTITTVASGEAKYVYLKNNGSVAGTWASIAFGVGSSTADAATLAGYGLLATGATLNQSHPVTLSGVSFTISDADRAMLYLDNGGAVITLPAASGIGSNFFFMVRNVSAGTTTLQASGADTIDGSASLQLAPDESAIVCCSGTAWYTVGLGRSTIFAYTQLVKNVAGGVDVTLTGTEAGYKIIKFTGALTANINVIVPNIVTVWYIDNSTTGVYSLTVKTSTGTGVPIQANNRVILYCDGTNVLDAQTVFTTSGLFTSGSASAPSISFSTDTDTGLYLAAANTVGFSGAGTQYMQIGPAGLALTTDLAVTEGGTGASTAAGARTNLGAAVSGANNDITSMTALTAASAAANPVRATDLQSQLVTSFTTGGTSTAYTLTPTPAITANAVGQRFRVQFHTAAGTTPTLAVSGQAALSLKYVGAGGVKTAVTSAQIQTNSRLDVENDGTDWVIVSSTGSGGATGGGSDAIFYENGQTVTTNYTITSGKNAMTAGPITINSGVTVTVPSGSTWTIV